MKKLLVIVFCFCFCCPWGGKAQDELYRMELGGGLGGAFYIGDANSKPFANLGPMGSIVARYIFNPRMAIKGNLAVGHISGDTGADFFPQDAGSGDAAGMFPINIEAKDYDSRMLDQFDELVADKGFPWKIRDLLPKVLLAGEDAGSLTEEGAKLLDPSGNLASGIPMCPPEGDAGTGMTATNSVAVRTGNVSAGTSVFAMAVLEKDLTKPYEEIDLVTTPAGDLVAMVHCNNCTSDLNAWVGLFKEFAESFGIDVDMNKLFGTLYNKALEGDPDCGGLLAYNYFSGEHITGFDEGRPLFVRSPESKFNLANFMRVHLYTSLGALKTGMDILLKKEDVRLDRMMGHGGLFKTRGVGQRILAGAIDTPVYVMETAGEGGAWGIALLADYLVRKEENESLTDYLNNKVFHDAEGTGMDPVAEDVEGYEKFMERYTKGLAIERAAVDCEI